MTAERWALSDMISQWRRRANRTEPMVAHQLWLHAEQVNRRRGHGA
jgi:hypothetical protein